MCSVKDPIVETVRDCIKELLDIDLITAYQSASSDTEIFPGGRYIDDTIWAVQYGGHP